MNCLYFNRNKIVEGKIEDLKPTNYDFFVVPSFSIQHNLHYNKAFIVVGFNPENNVQINALLLYFFTVPSVFRSYLEKRNGVYYASCGRDLLTYDNTIVTHD